MPSKSFNNFIEIDDLDIVTDLYGSMETLEKEEGEDNSEYKKFAIKAGLVLMVSYWEAYVEDLCAEAITNILENVDDSKELPKILLKQIAKEIKEDKNELAMFCLTNGGWKEKIKTRLDNFISSRNRNFNSPKSSSVRDFFKGGLGIDDITADWHDEDGSSKDYCNTLDKIVTMRGSVAHRGKMESEISLSDFKKYRKAIRIIISKTGGCVNKFVRNHTGKSLFVNK